MRQITVFLALIVAALVAGSVGTQSTISALEQSNGGTPTTAPEEGTGQEGSADTQSGSSTIWPTATVGGVTASWGLNASGQLGDRTNRDSNVPVRVRDLSEVTALAGGALHSLALRNDGTVWAWGENFDSQLGNGTNSDSNVAVQVEDPSDPSGFLQSAKAIAGGNNHSLALKNDGTVWAWGDNSSSQLGDGTLSDRNVAVQVKDPSDPSGFLQNVMDVDSGGSHGLALKNDGTVSAWGSNTSGQLGDGTTTNRNAAVQVKDPSDPSGSLQNVTAVSAGAVHSLALKNDGTVAAWGSNGSSQIGDGTNTNTDRIAPVQVRDLNGVKAIDAGGAHNLAVKNKITNNIIRTKKKKKKSRTVVIPVTIPVVMAWGSNGSSQLGDGTSTDRNVPVQVKDPSDPSGFLQNVTTVSGGLSHNLALKNDSTVSAWGANGQGQLGLGNMTNSNVSVPVSELSGVTDVAAGGVHSLVK